MTNPTAQLDALKAEAVRSRGFLRGAETQLSKVVALLDVEPVPASILPRVEVIEKSGLRLYNTVLRADADEVALGLVEGDKHDALRLHQCEDALVEHVSLSGAVDEVLSVTESRGVSVRHALISTPSRDVSLHPDGHAHDYGLLIVGVPAEVGWGDHAPVRIERCLLADIGGRGPTIMPSFPDRDGVMNGTLHCQLVNNVVWQPLYAGLKSNSTNEKHHVGTVKADIVGNLYILTEQSSASRIKRTMQRGDWGDVYARDNWIILADGSRHDLFEWAGVTPGRNDPNFDVTGYIADPDELLDALLAEVGARPLDEHDQRIINKIREQG